MRCRDHIRTGDQSDHQLATSLLDNMSSRYQSCRVSAILPFLQSISHNAVILLALVITVTAQAQDPSIERLLKKLPPPETLVKRPPVNVRDELEVLGDPLTNRLWIAVAYRNWSQAKSLALRLIENHPNNPWVHCMRGSIATELARFPEASAAFRDAVRVRPKFAYGFLQLGSVEVIQQHFAAAIPHFQKVVELDPEAAIGWVFLSGCTEKLGRRKESLDYAKRAIAVAPNAAGAWLQLARAENALGHSENAKRALAQAQQIMRRPNA
jgi:tetratricopeptide (TPR) repeat protein